MTSVFFTYPPEMIRIPMAYATQSAQSPPGAHAQLFFLSAMRQIYHKGQSVLAFPSGAPPTSLFARLPILKFYRGFTVALVGIIPYAGISFLAWGLLRSHFLPAPAPSSSGSSPTSYQESCPLAVLVIGALAGALAQTASCPFDVVRRRMQVGGLIRPDRWLRWGETLRAVWAVRGWCGFYVGLVIGYLKVVPMKAVSFAVWEWARSVLDLRACHG